MITLSAQRALSATGVTLALLLTFEIGISTANAHSQLLSSTPVEGQVLAIAPAEISMQFSDDVLSIGGAVRIADKKGTNWAAGPLIIHGPVVTQLVSLEAPEGAYQIRWRVVSADGHPISGIINFTVDGNAHPTIIDAKEPAAGHVPTSAPAKYATSSSTRLDFDRLIVVAWGIAGVAAVAALSALVLLIRRLRRRCQLRRLRAGPLGPGKMQGEES